MSKPFKPAIPEFTPQGHQISPNNVPFQITSITHPSQNDILMGRGGGTNNHAGNLNYRKIIEQFKPVYSKSPKNGKLQYSCKVVDIVRSLNPPGRFLKKDAATGLFYDIGEKAARDKTSQCLREGQPELRRAMGLVQGTAKKGKTGRVKKMKGEEGEDVTSTAPAPRRGGGANPQQHANPHYFRGNNNFTHANNKYSGVRPESPPSPDYPTRSVFPPHSEG
eukprot:CAMPEP_0182504848 /NCGR_PEP_ID=MMETSP1321-20130603/17986_1 /TAXON_ID=91990 /ORGANISM="Bolidomonas sp., Strain RCC1657" /LENGTH=220 /DNA_ID=CAMNT_0024710281 /DNA_START=124 /DNA_END=782 /DNA_ORIENTATION=+